LLCGSVKVIQESAFIFVACKNVITVIAPVHDMMKGTKISNSFSSHAFIILQINQHSNIPTHRPLVSDMLWNHRISGAMDFARGVKDRDSRSLNCLDPDERLEQNILH
jgi:hypothetical protein